jgi:hypothetical protein
MTPPPGRGSLAGVRNPFPHTENLFDASGELAEVDLTAQREAWDALSGPAAAGIVAAVLAEPQRYAPPVLHQVSAILCAAGRPTDAAFWFHAAQLRTRFDLARASDETITGIADELTATFGPAIEQWVHAEPGRLRDLAARVVAWDRVTTYEYEHRWINLHGLGPGYYRYGERYSRLPDQWPAIADRVRSEFLAAAEVEPPGTPIVVTPTGEHAEIDVAGEAEAITALHGPEPAAAVEAVLAAPHRHTPPVLSALAAALFAGGRREEGATWYYAAQLRARFDVERCADPTVGDAVAILRERYGEPINRWAFTDLPRLRTIVERAVAWDRATPHDYDHRWINLHGMGAFGLDPGAPLSRPEAEWPAIAEQIRTDYLTGLYEVLDDLGGH